LQRKGVAPESSAAVLDRFEEVGLIDDRDYAEAFVESRHRVRGQGGRVLSAELRRRGVAGDVVAEAVGGLDPEREFETACRIARSRYERMPAVPPEVKVRRLVGFLARKGYSGTIVTRAVRHVVETADSAAVDSSVMEAAEALDAGALEEDGMDG
jgi:regulatory protein